MKEPAAGPKRPVPEVELQPSGRGVGHLGPLLAWAIVFADIGTSVFYVPAILYAEVGALAPWFVLVVAVAFIFVAAGHLEIAHRYPKGGGGVAAATEAFGPRVGVMSGALMVSAYLLTIAISAVTALHYIAAIQPFAYEIPVLSVVAVPIHGILNWIGVRELSRLALAFALATLALELTLAVAVVAKVDPTTWLGLRGQLTQMAGERWDEAAAGFAAAWLAFSGLAIEGARAAHVENQPALLAAVAEIYGGRALLVMISLCGAGFLLVAANVAFIGCYNVFKAVGELGYLPAALAARNKRFGTPRGAIIVITLAAILLVVVTGGGLLSLGKIFAFGLLGSYAITSISLDVIAWREKRRGLRLLVGAIATLALLFPWVTSWLTKPRATLYGILVTGIQLGIAFVTHRGWIRSGRFGYLRAASAERAAAGPGAQEVVTLEEAVELRAAYPSTTMVALRGRNHNLCREAARRARGAGDAAVVLIVVDEVPGLFFPPRTGPSDDALEVLEGAVADIADEKMAAVPVWRLAHDAGASIAEAAEALGIRCVFMGTTARSAVWQFLRGNVLKRLLRELPEPVHVVICE